MPVGDEPRDTQGYLCQEADQHLPSAKRNTRGNRDNGNKAERRNQRKQEKVVAGSLDEMAELREHAAEQAALFNLGVEEADTVDTAEQSTPGDHVSQ
jgi:hypothetical protein